jgi:hypothetical protein
MIFKSNRRKIDFLVGGTQKGGTSALDYYLRRHPEIGMGRGKELHFFDNEHIFSKFKINYSRYTKHFDFTSQKKMYGESTPIYLYWSPSCRRIWEYNPNIKLIFILRNPITRAFSLWNMEYDRQADKEDFGYAIRNENFRVKEALPLQHRVYSYTDRGFYSEQIRRFKRFFSDNQLMFIKYEDYKANQENTLINIFKFLGVDPGSYAFEYKTVHNRKKHAKISVNDKLYLLDKFKCEVRQVEKLLDWDCSDWLK